MSRGFPKVDLSYGVLNKSSNGSPRPTSEANTLVAYFILGFELRIECLSQPFLHNFEDDPFFP